MTRIAALVLTALLAPAAHAATADFADLPAGETAGPVARLEGTLSAFTIDAPGGLFADGAGTLSTVLDGDPFSVVFDTPVRGATFAGGVVGEFFQQIAGEISVAGGGASETFTLGGDAPEALAFAPGAPLASLDITLVSFDTDASSVGFLGLTAVDIAPIPLPAGVALLASAVALLGWRGRVGQAAA